MVGPPRSESKSEASPTIEPLTRRITYTDVQNVQNIWTARKIEVFDSDRNSRTILSLDKLQYNVPMKDEQFTIQALRRES